MIPSPKNIYIIGAQSTGKTYLVSELKKHHAELASLSGQNHPGSSPQSKDSSSYSASSSSSSSSPPPPPPFFITEVARTVLRRYDFSRDDIKSDAARCLELQQKILEAQYGAEQACLNASGSLGEWYVCDRSGLDPIVYASMYLDSVAVEGLLARDEWVVLQRRMRAGLVFLLEPVREWVVDDGTRLMVDWEEQMLTHACFERLLCERSIGYRVLTAERRDIALRVDMILGAVRKSKQDLDVEMV